MISHSRWTKSFENFFKSFTQLTSRLGLIRGHTSMIRKLDSVRILPGPNPDLHCDYHPHANFLGLDGGTIGFQSMALFLACRTLRPAPSVALLTARQRRSL